jgi:hypothetical protein
MSIFKGGYYQQGKKLKNEMLTLRRKTIRKKKRQLKVTKQIPTVLDPAQSLFFPPGKPVI